MRYIGSKTASLAAIERALLKYSPSGSEHVCDPFAGICTVSQHLKSLGYRLTTGDLLEQSFVFQRSTIVLNRPPRFAALRAPLGLSHSRPAYAQVLDYVNSLKGVQDYISENYSSLSTTRRKFFTRTNARKIDAIRLAIYQWAQKGFLSQQEEAYLLVSLLNAVDRISNTAGTYYAFLKTFYRKARKKLLLKPVPIVSNNKRTNRAYLMDARQLVKCVHPDILYLDPPYNERDYGAYYHLTESIVRWNRSEPRGRAGLPIDRSPKSDFCKPGLAEQALEDLIRSSSAKLILLHYAVDGLVPHRRILEILSDVGPTVYQTWRVRRYTSRGRGHQTCRNRLYVCRPRR